jgi:hypothetical protein
VERSQRVNYTVGVAQLSAALVRDVRVGPTLSAPRYWLFDEPLPSYSLTKGCARFRVM